LVSGPLTYFFPPPPWEVFHRIDFQRIFDNAYSGRKTFEGPPFFFPSPVPVNFLKPFRPPPPTGIDRPFFVFVLREILFQISQSVAFSHGPPISPPHYSLFSGYKICWLLSFPRLSQTLAVPFPIQSLPSVRPLRRSVIIKMPRTDFSSVPSTLLNQT